jgi:hypothetical protein
MRNPAIELGQLAGSNTATVGDGRAGLGEPDRSVETVPLDQRVVAQHGAVADLRAVAVRVRLATFE